MHPVAGEKLDGRDLKDLFELSLKLVDRQVHERGEIFDMDRFVVVLIDVLYDFCKLAMRTPAFAGFSEVPRDAGDSEDGVVSADKRYFGGYMPVDATVII